MPLFATDLQLLRLTNVIVFAIALLGLNILVGYASKDYQDALKIGQKYATFRRYAVEGQ